MSFSANITKRKIRGAEKYVVNCRHPVTKKRMQRFRPTKKEALEVKRQLYIDFEEDAFTNENKKQITIATAFGNWISDKQGEVKDSTLKDYQSFKEFIVGPIRLGSAQEKAKATLNGGSLKTTEALGNILISELTTVEIRTWHKFIQSEFSSYKADKAKKFLGAILDQAAEDYDIKIPSLPKKNGKKRTKQKKNILTPDEFSILFREARRDRENGIYYIFPFLTGVRPSEQLGLLWEDIDLEARTIKIQRMQDSSTGEIHNFTKTDSGTRIIPISNLLLDLLKAWKEICPKSDSQPYRVFPSKGIKQKWPLPRIGAGGPLLYSNFRNRVWKPVFERLKLPYVTPHSARHFFISNLQAQGVEVGLVAKLAGHSNPTITLGHYTQAVRGGEEAVEALTNAFSE